MHFGFMGDLSMDHYVYMSCIVLAIICATFLIITTLVRDAYKSDLRRRKESREKTDAFDAAIGITCIVIGVIGLIVVMTSIFSSIPAAIASGEDWGDIMSVPILDTIIMMLVTMVVSLSSWKPLRSFHVSTVYWAFCIISLSAEFITCIMIYFKHIWGY